VISLARTTTAKPCNSSRSMASALTRAAAASRPPLKTHAALLSHKLSRFAASAHSKASFSHKARPLYSPRSKCTAPSSHKLQPLRGFRFQNSFALTRAATLPYRLRCSSRSWRVHKVQKISVPAKSKPRVVFRGLAFQKT